MIIITKYRIHPSLRLANIENLFYHSKNQHGLTPVGAVAAILSSECWRQSARFYF
ncbi:hypothetical protein SAMN03159401_0539 [Klebsiella quasipneumoniae]|nr:hypothetical protein SAMN03159325_4573 [Klebsiella quasipneumoniae]SEA00722.1 hypothetical protein SAMN03159401_0539 [Klebsiella quasipneumoniae]SFP46251.1 hypothetical protein SAMN03159330_2352 [Klebsiella quasipneumoniae]SFX53848.1 hypothetical protein SAMN03159400_3154 [Klebsiella quasipneumoniae]SFY05665.1 hypothetical protein SAMN03159513_4491 [Klebsiella quasipneumoniae]